MSGAITAGAIHERVSIDWASDLLINGSAVRGTGETVVVQNPATEETLAEPPAASLIQVDDAVATADLAFRTTRWASDPVHRANVIAALADLLDERREEFTEAIVREVGTPISLARTLQVSMAVDSLRSYAALAAVDRTEHLPEVGAPGANGALVAYRAIGVIAALTAYNYPLYLAAQKIGAALAAGCTVVLAPSPLAPLATLMFGQLAREVVPPGVLNVVFGGPSVGEALTSDPRVAKISFTGSVGVGEKIMSQAARGVRGVVLELGGKSPNIILPGTDLEKVIDVVHSRYLRNAGQGCSSPTRILVERSRYEQFAELSCAYVDTVSVGDPFDEKTLVGPVISADHQARIADHVDRALAGGAELLAGGTPVHRDRGWWSPPTVLGGVDNSAAICQEEIFGPVSVVIAYDDVEEAIDIANGTTFGLAASVYGPSPSLCLDVADRMRAGLVTINGGGSMRTDAPFGGMRSSGIGREIGEWGVREFLEPQQIQWSIN